MTSRQRDDSFLIREQESTRTDEQGIDSALNERCNGRFDVADAGNIDNDELPPGCFRRGLHVVSFRLGLSARGSQHADCPLGRELAKKLQSLRPNTAEKKTTPVTLPPGRSRVATRPR